MNCPGSEKILALIDGELTPEEQASVREHIAGCAACRRLIEKQKLIEDTWRESYTSPSDFEFNAFEKRLTNKLFRRSWVRTALPVAAAFVAVLLGVRIFIIDGPNESLLQRIPMEPVSPAMVTDSRISGGDSLNGTILEHSSESTGEREELVLEEENLISSSDQGMILPDLPAAAGEEDIDSLDRLLNVAGAASPDDEMQYTHSEQEAETAGLIEGYSTSGAVPQNEGVATGEICPDTDPAGILGLEAGRGISTVESLSSNYTVGNVESTSAAASDAPAQSDETLVAGGSGGGAGGVVGYGYTENVEHSADDGSTVAECAEAVAQSAPEGVDYREDAYRDDEVVFAAVVASLADTQSTEECPTSDGEAGERSVMLILGSDTRYRTDDVTSALEQIEQDIQMDWNRKSVPMSTLLPVSISISFRIASDGTVYDVSVTAPSDSFFNSILPGLEERIATLRFERTDDTLDTVVLEVVLF